MATQMPTRADFEAMLNEQLGGAGDEGFEGPPSSRVPSPRSKTALP